MLKEPALSLHAPGLKISSPLVFSCQHQSPRNCSGIEPRIAWAWAGCHCAATNAQRDAGGESGNDPHSPRRTNFR